MNKSVVLAAVAVFASAVVSCGAAEQAAVPAHPRLFADDARYAKLKTFCSRDALGKAYKARLLAVADRLLSEKPVERVVTGRRLLDVSRTALARLTHLVFAWKLTGERKYADRGVAELKAVCGFSDWHTEHYLDTGEMALAAGIAYDGFYSVLTPEARRLFAKAIAVRSLETWNWNHWWAKSSSNWNAVCNAGTLAVCWALWDDPDVGALARERPPRRVGPRSRVSHAMVRPALIRKVRCTGATARLSHASRPNSCGRSRVATRS